MTIAFTEQELQDPETWDFDQAKVIQPSKSPGAVVSVRFNKKDLSLVSDAARQNDMKTSEFIRCAAIEKANAESRKVIVTVSPSAGLNVRTTAPVNWQRTFGMGRVRVASRILPGWGAS